MPKYDLLMFDMDGTFIDSLQFHALAYYRFFKQLGYDVTLDVTKRGIATTIDQMLDTVGVKMEDRDEIYRELAEFYRTGADDLIREIPLATGAHETFRALKDKGYSLCVVTNSLQPATDRILSLHGLDGYFDVVEGATQRETDKKKRCEKSICALCGAGKPLYVGDVARDLEIANQIGCDSCLAAGEIAWEKDTDGLIGRYRPTYVIRALPELLNIL